MIYQYMPATLRGQLEIYFEGDSSTPPIFHKHQPFGLKIDLRGQLQGMLIQGDIACPIEDHVFMELLAYYKGVIL